MSEPDLQTANRQAAWKWGSLIVGLLGLQVAGGIFTIVLATGEESVVVVPDYYQKTLHWDEAMAAKRASNRLGWKCVMEAMPISEDRGYAGLIATLKDDRDEIIKAKQGTLRWFQHNRANSVQELMIPSGSLTMMRLEDCFDANGLWDVTIDVTDFDGNRFTQTATLKIPKALASPPMRMLIDDQPQSPPEPMDE
ncbi:MAG: FixH family protein [Planctomycetota bacterium]|nr:FixH family protein [Planctomycetota bacterium]